MRGKTRWVTALAAAAWLTSPSLVRPAAAQVMQPDGTVVPDPPVGCFDGKPGGLGAVFACACDQPEVCNIGAPCPGGSTSCDPGNNATCESTLWHTVNNDPCIPDNSSGLDPINDAAVKPETFRPVCGLTFTLLARQAIFKNAFGWYNVVAGGQAPAAADLHLLIDCNTKLKQPVSLSLIAQPAYKGGDIGFFLVTPESHDQPGSCAKGDCCASVARAAAGEGRVYYSEPKLNPDNSGASSFVHLLIHHSKIDDNTFYFSWEDTFGGSTNEFTDLVTRVSGISCAGAGKQCDTGKPGVCGLGVTKCDDDGNVFCAGSNTSAVETCDGLDNDCDGEIDDGDALCPEGTVCHRGVCVPHCREHQEFACQLGFSCDTVTGLCVDDQCKNVVCKAAQVCRGGHCENGCDGVVCPSEQICMAGACVDLCAGRNCGDDEVCRLGVCLPDCTTCGGITCSDGLSCDPQTGDCFDPSCSAPCPDNTSCAAGQCVSACEGVVCPGGVACENGQCPPPGIGKAPPTPELPDAPAGEGQPDVAGAGLTDDGGPFDSSGCGCHLTSPPPVSGLLLLVGLAALRRRRR